MSCLVEINHLTYDYPEGQPALSDVSFHVKHGDRVGLIGPNGAGKTTLMMALSGVLTGFEGSAVVAGCDLRTRTGRRAIHRKLGVVFQNTDDQIVNASVYEDIAFGPLNLGLTPGQAKERVEEAMRQVGLDESYRSRLPFHLSSGEKRRVAIAGVMAMQPNVLLMDEPSTDLDPRGRRELVEILNGLDITRLISSHNLEFVRETCQRVVLLDGGRIRADGRAEEILSDPRLMLDHGLEVPWSLR